MKNIIKHHVLIKDRAKLASKYNFVLSDAVDNACGLIFLLLSCSCCHFFSSGCGSTPTDFHISSNWNMLMLQMQKVSAHFQLLVSCTIMVYFHVRWMCTVIVACLSIINFGASCYVTDVHTLQYMIA